MTVSPSERSYSFAIANHLDNDINRAQKPRRVDVEYEASPVNKQFGQVKPKQEKNAVFGAKQNNHQMAKY